MNINTLCKIIEKKISEEVNFEFLDIQDKTYLHEKHKSHDKKKFHIKIIITSDYLRNKNRIQSTKEIYQVLDVELKNYIHSIQVLIN